MQTEDSDHLVDGMVNSEKAMLLGEIAVKMRQFRKTSSKSSGNDGILNKETKAHEKELKGRDIFHSVK